MEKNDLETNNLERPKNTHYFFKQKIQNKI